MRKQLLTSVAAAAVMSFAATAWAIDNNTANNNTGTAVTQDHGQDAIASPYGPAVDDGAYAGVSNALGLDAQHNAVADQKSTAVQVYAPNGVADHGSAANIGDGNRKASAALGSAATSGNSSPAISVEGYPTDGSTSVTGNNNLTAAAHDGGAAVGANGTAVGIDDVDITAKDVTTAFGKDNVVSAAHLNEVSTFSSKISLEAGGGFHLNEGGGGGGFHIDANAGLGGAVAYGPNASITTGDIAGQSLGSLTGANMYAGNTGVANQGDAIGIGAQNSF